MLIRSLFLEHIFPQEGQSHIYRSVLLTTYIFLSFLLALGPIRYFLLIIQGLEGPVFGSSDQWIGLGVFFDSFDNDNKHNNPYIMAMVNDGSKNFDHQNDGATQQLGGCLRDFRYF
jgi:hypothetical protein